jgi:hypothetical protein
MLSFSDSKVLRRRLCDVFVIVHGYLMEKFGEARSKVECIRGIIKEGRLIEDDELMSDLVVDLLVYNEVLFEPVFASRQSRLSQ